LVPEGVPSLTECELLEIEGRFHFGPEVKIVGKVRFVNRGADSELIAPGVYKDGEFGSR
jgi:hypothetical protein